MITHGCTEASCTLQIHAYSLSFTIYNRRIELQRRNPHALARQRCFRKPATATGRNSLDESQLSHRTIVP